MRRAKEGKRCGENDDLPELDFGTAVTSKQILKRDGANGFALGHKGGNRPSTSVNN
jgi:hypothetical protein